MALLSCPKSCAPTWVAGKKSNPKSSAFAGSVTVEACRFLPSAPPETLPKFSQMFFTQPPKFERLLVTIGLDGQGRLS